MFGFQACWVFSYCIIFFSQQCYNKTMSKGTMLKWGLPVWLTKAGNQHPFKWMDGFNAKVNELNTVQVTFLWVSINKHTNHYGSLAMWCCFILALCLYHCCSLTIRIFLVWLSDLHAYMFVLSWYLNSLAKWISLGREDLILVYLREVS